MCFPLLDHKVSNKICPHLCESFTEIKRCLCRLSDSRLNIIRKLTVSSEEALTDTPESRRESEQIPGGSFIISAGVPLEKTDY